MKQGKIIFEPSDFRGSGQMVVRNSAPLGNDNISFLASVSYKVGYTYTKEFSVCAISLSDGMITGFGSGEQLCEHLNNDSWGYRPMTKQEIRDVMEYCGNRFNE